MRNISDFHWGNSSEIRVSSPLTACALCKFLHCFDNIDLDSENMAID